MLKVGSMKRTFRKGTHFSHITFSSVINGWTCPVYKMKYLTDSKCVLEYKNEDKQISTFDIEIPGEQMQSCSEVIPTLSLLNWLNCCLNSKRVAGIMSRAAPMSILSFWTQNISETHELVKPQFSQIRHKHAARLSLELKRLSEIPFFYLV